MWAQELYNASLLTLAPECRVGLGMILVALASQIIVVFFGKNNVLYLGLEGRQ